MGGSSPESPRSFVEPTSLKNPVEEEPEELEALVLISPEPPELEVVLPFESVPLLELLLELPGGGPFEPKPVVKSGVLDRQARPIRASRARGATGRVRDRTGSI